MIDWTKILLALITLLGTVTTVGGGILGTYLMIRLRSMQRGQTATNSLVNGRVDELVTAAEQRGYASGHRDGRAGVCEAIAKSPKLSVDAQGMAEVMSQTAVPKEKA